MSYSFRKAELEELQSVFLLFRRAINHMCNQKIYQWDEHYPDLKTLQNDIRKQQMYVLCEGERILAATVINNMYEEEYATGEWRDNGKFAVIHRLCVDPEHQNSGLGKKTMLLAEKVIKEKGYTSIRLDAFSQNPYALRLYKNLGYKTAGEIDFGKGIFCLFEKLL
jgi:ribosomal protein S18 acetylase RimI-like enzyme